MIEKCLLDDVTQANKIFGIIYGSTDTKVSN